MQMGHPLSIDPLTDKPKINFVLSSGVRSREKFRQIRKMKLWTKRARRIIAMGGQITHKPRNFVNRIDDIWMKSLYNDNAHRVHVPVGRPHEERGRREVALGLRPQVNIDVKEQDPKTGEEGSIAIASE